MLSAFLGDISGRRRRKRNLLQAEERLLERLDRHTVLDIDEDLAAALAVGHKTLKRAAYSLALKESLHLLANAENALRVMTNAEYGRFMTARSGTSSGVRPGAVQLEAIPSETGQNVSRVSREAESIPLPMAEMESDLFTGATLGGAPQYPEYEWFAIDVALPGAENVAGSNKRENRKILPEREREPWANAQGVGLD